MGCWGIEPRQGDGAQDAVLILADSAARDLIHLWDRAIEFGERGTWTRWERLGVAQTLSEDWHVSIPLDVAKLCLEDLEEVAKDVEFMASWRSPREFAIALKRMHAWLGAEIARVEKQNAVRRRRRGPRNKKRKFWARTPVRLIYGPLFGHWTCLERRKKSRLVVNYTLGGKRKKALTHAQALELCMKRDTEFAAAVDEVLVEAKKRARVLEQERKERIAEMGGRYRRRRRQRRRSRAKG